MAQIKGKQIASGSIASDRLDLSDDFAFSGSVTASNPTAGSQVATKSYVDSTVTGGQAGLDFKESVRLTSDGSSLNDANASTSFTYASGVITEDSAQTATVQVDGTALALNNRVLLKDETDAIENGIYEVTRVGDGSSTTWELTRAADADTSAELTAGAFVFTEAGTVNANRSYVLQTVQSGVNAGQSPTLDTDDLSFVQYSGAGQIKTPAAGGLAKSGDELSIDISNLNIINLSGVTTLDMPVGNSSTQRRTPIREFMLHPFGLGNVSVPHLGFEIPTGYSNFGLVSIKAGDGITVDSNGVSAALPQRDSGSPTSTLSADDSATGISISAAPAGGSDIRVTVNGVGITLGNGSTTGDAYFTDGSGGARAFSAVVANDELYWNGDITGNGSFALEATDIVEIFYNA